MKSIYRSSMRDILVVDENDYTVVDGLNQYEEGFEIGDLIKVIEKEIQQLEVFKIKLCKQMVWENR